MFFRWLNSFTVLAAILIAIGVIGFASGGNMVFDPGRDTTGKEWVLYLLAGILMLVNGLLPPTSVREDELSRPDTDDRQRYSNHNRDEDGSRTVSVSSAAVATSSVPLRESSASETDAATGR
jgi:hypothetical protein